MSRNIDRVIAYFKQLGVSQEESEVFINILTNGSSTALSISRSMNLPRTTVYRILDSLISKKLIVTQLGERGLKYVAISPNDIQMLVDAKEAELYQMKRTALQLQEELQTLEQKESQSQKVFYYSGIEGIKQITYNSLKANGELLTYEMSNMNAFMSQKEAEKYRQKFVENSIYIRTLTNAKHLDDWTNVTEMVTKYWNIRHIAATAHPFQFEILIYNDIYAMYRYTDNSIFCVEIQSEELASMQKQLFEYLWNIAIPFRILSDHGQAEVIMNA